MVVYIKENEIVTETFYDNNIIEELLSLGFQAVTVPEVDEPSYYKIFMFEKVNNTWKLK